MNDVEKIARLRDELRLHIHLAKAETRDLFERLEMKWQELQRKLRPVKTASREAAADIGVAARELLEELYEGYLKVEKAVKSLKA